MRNYKENVTNLMNRKRESSTLRSKWKKKWNRTENSG